MEQYIKKSNIIAELEDWRDKIKKGIFSIPLSGSDRAYATFEYEILGKIKDLLDTLEVKEIREDIDVDLNPIFEEFGIDPDSRFASMFKEGFYKGVDRYLNKKENKL